MLILVFIWLTSAGLLHLPKIKTASLWPWITGALWCGHCMCRNNPETAWGVMRTWERHRLSRFFCSGSALVCTGLVGADSTLTLRLIQEQPRPCYYPGIPVAHQGMLRLLRRGEYSEYFSDLITYFVIYFLCSVSLRSTSTSWTGKDTTKPYKHTEGHAATCTVSS